MRARSASDPVGRSRPPRPTARFSSRSSASISTCARSLRTGSPVRFGVVDLGLQLEQAPAVLALRPGVEARAEIGGDRRVGPAGELEGRHLDARCGQQPSELSQAVAVGQPGLAERCVGAPRWDRRGASTP